MVATATNLKAPALPPEIEVNGQMMRTPDGAVGIVGKLNGHELFVVRNGQTLQLQAGDWLMEGDRVVTTSAANQTLFFAGDNSVSTLRRIDFSRGADFKIRQGEIYTTALLSERVVNAAEALPGQTQTVGADEVPAAEPTDTLLADEAAGPTAVEGFFGGPVAMGAGAVLGVGGAALALAGLSNNDAAPAEPASAPANGSSAGNGMNPDSGGNGDETGDDSAGGGDSAPATGPFSSGAQQLADALPLEMLGAPGAQLEMALVAGAAQLESMSPASRSPAAPAGSEQATSSGVFQVRESSPPESPTPLDGLSSTLAPIGTLASGVDALLKPLLPSGL